MGWKRFPVLGEALKVGVDALGECLLAEFVGFGEDDAEGNIALSEPLQELEVDLLWRVPAVDEHEEIDELAPLEDVARDHILEFLSLRLAAFGKAIAG